MQVDLRTVNIKPLRQTYDVVAAHTGSDRAASRYLEGTIGIQVETNFHYRPLWNSNYEIFDPGRTAVKMKDWYDLKDPRQFYYGTYTINRARMQETVEADFEFVERRNLVEQIPAETAQIFLDLLLPLRHVEWGGNMNNASICAYGYGTAITQPCIYQAMDHLGMAQYITRTGLLFDEPTVLDRAREAWMNDSMWQPLRRYVEDSFVIEDWFELYIAQNLALTGLLYPLIYDEIDGVLSAEGGPVLSVLTRFQNEWYAENVKWVDASIRTAAAESPQNAELLSVWARKYRDPVETALKPLALRGLGSEAENRFEDLVASWNRRATSLGLTV